MSSNKLFPLIITDQLAQTRTFYTDQAGFRVSIEQGDYLQVCYGDGDGPELCFISGDEIPGFGRLPRFSGHGLVVSIPTKDADAAHASMLARGTTPRSAPTNTPWGWRSFTVTDPNGVILDFFHPIQQSTAADAPG